MHVIDAGIPSAVSTSMEADGDREDAGIMGMRNMFNLLVEEVAFLRVDLCRNQWGSDPEN